MKPARKATTRKRRGAAKGDSLEGQLLVAMPQLTDKWFGRSVVYMCAHSAKGAMGLIVNQRAKNISFPDLLAHLEITVPGEKAASSGDVSDRCVHIGGPVETARGFVLHSDDYADGSTTLTVDDGICLTATVEIVRAMARGSGPTQSLLALGYASWGAGQLETELQSNTWLYCPPDAELIFGTDLDVKHERAMAKIGIVLGHLVSQAGRA